MLGWHVTHGENSGLQSGMCRYLSLHAACVDSACQSIGNSANYLDSARFDGNLSCGILAFGSVINSLLAAFVEGFVAQAVGVAIFHALV